MVSILRTVARSVRAERVCALPPLSEVLRLTQQLGVGAVAETAPGAAGVPLLWNASRNRISTERTQGYSESALWQIQ